MIDEKQILGLLKERKEFLSDHSGCITNREDNIQTGQEEMLQEIIELIETWEE